MTENCHPRSSQLREIQSMRYSPRTLTLEVSNNPEHIKLKKIGLVLNLFPLIFVLLSSVRVRQVQ